MQTRKNRKNDEISYEKMFKMGHELKKALSILEMVKKREKCKKELLQLTIEIFDKRYQVFHLLCVCFVYVGVVCHLTIFLLL